MDVAPDSEKGAGELAYWKKCRKEEGRLDNSWYERFYTAQFGLSYQYYQGKRILDIGCGPRGSLEWAWMARRRVGLDPLAEEYLQLGASVHAMEYVSAGAERMPFPNESFDVVCSFNSLDHVDDPHSVISEIKRVTAVGGLLLLMVDIHRRPTRQEPIVLPWDIDRHFQPEFQYQIMRHLEKGEHGLYQSVEVGIPFDHSDPTDRYGILVCRMVRVARGADSPLDAPPSARNLGRAKRRLSSWRSRFG